MKKFSKESLLLEPPPLGCVLYLPGLPGGASKTYDRSPYGNVGTITGATWTRLPRGLWCLDFDGVDDYIAIPQTASMSGWTAGTIGIWLNMRATPSGYLVAYADVRQTATMRVHLAFYGGSTAPRIAFINEAGATVSALSPDQLSLNTWYHVVGTFDATTDETKIYVNGVLKETDTTAFVNVITTAHDYINVGGRQGTGTFNGLLGEVRLYNRALTSLEIQHIYLATEWRYR